MGIRISASLVLYNCLLDTFAPAVNSYLNGISDGILVISDNSEAPSAHDLFLHPRVRYIFNNKNLGFGAAHNRAITAVASESDFHLILNPDIQFGPEVLPHLVDVMQGTPKIGVLMPRVNYPDGSLQHLCKLLPTPVDLILRRFLSSKLIQATINRRYELHDLPQDRLIDIPTVSGCFLLVRTKILLMLGGFDTRYFMYLEDVDLVRRIGSLARVAYDPRVSITHAYAKGSYRNKKLLGYHVASAFRYFTKWGWWFDSERKARNASMTTELSKVRD